MVNVLISTGLSVGLGLIKQAMMKDTFTSTEGPRLETSQITGASEGTAVPRIWGRFRVGGQLIWATNFREEVVVDRTERGGKGGPKQISESTTYKYYASFAIGLCESTGGFRLSRVFIDGAQVELSRFNYRFYDGSETQNPDPKIAAVEGVAPAYRGLCYMVFEEVELTDYGNRIPQMSVEINAPGSASISGTVEGLMRSVALIPGTGEFRYATEAVTKSGGSTESTVVNVNTTNVSTPDLLVSLDQLESDAPNVDSVSISATWFGNSLDATICEVRPKVESTSIATAPLEWRVSDQTRAGTPVATTDGQGRPVLGGTPSDQSVRQVVAEAKRRGMRVMFNPIMLMDINSPGVGAGIPLTVVNPNASLGLSGWTVDSGTWDASTLVFKSTSAVNGKLSQIVAFPPGYEDKAVFLRGNVRSSNPVDCTVLFGIDFLDSSFALLSDVTTGYPGLDTVFTDFSLTQAPPTGTAYVRINLISEFTGTGEVDFDDIELLIVDLFPGPGVAYPWRGRVEGDATDFFGTVTPAQVGAWNGTTVPYSGPSGEWSHRRMILHYARLLANLLVPGDAFLIGSELAGISRTDATWGTKLAALMSDVRSILPSGVLVSYAADWTEYRETSLAPLWSSADFIGIDNYFPITDWFEGDQVYNVEAFRAGINSGEFWDYTYASEADRANGIQTPITDPAQRGKDIKTWATTNYPGKPVWFTEFGCPAMDKGANQPSVFFNILSTEPKAPYRSNGNRNDTVQRLYLQAMLEYWTDDGFVLPENMFVRGWDARPFPQFPGLTGYWSDGLSWVYGHWLNGRLGATTLGQLTRNLMLRAGYSDADFDISRVSASGIVISGMGVFEVTTWRAIIENLMRTYSYDVLESNGIYKFVMRSASDTLSIPLDDLVMSGDNSFVKTRVQDVELPDRTTVKFLDEVRDYAATTVDGHTITGESDRVDDFVSNCVLPVDYAQNLADILTQERWVAKNAITFSLPMTYLRVEPGDAFDFTVDGITRRYRIGSKTIGDQIDIEAAGYSEAVYESDPFGSALPGAEVATPYGASTVIFAELPVSDELSPNLWSPRVLAAQRPWPGGVLIFEDDNAGGYLFNSRQSIPAVVGVLTTDMPRGPVDLWDTSTVVGVRFDDPTVNLASTTDAAVLNGANLLAVLTPSGEWEVFQFASAVLELDGSFTLSRLLRGKLGTEPYIGDPTPAGSRVVVYDPARFGVISGTEDRFGIPFEARFGPAGIDVTDNRYTDMIVTPRGVAYRPWSPVHLRQTRIGNDIQLSWIRRTRFNGDPWVDGEVPLSEENERYEVEIIGGSTLTVVGTTSVLYTLAQQITDFGVAQTAVAWTVYQMSDRFGRGAPANG